MSGCSGWDGEFAEIPTPPPPKNTAASARDKMRGVQDDSSVVETQVGCRKGILEDHHQSV